MCVSKNDRDFESELEMESIGVGHHKTKCKLQAISDYLTMIYRIELEHFDIVT